MNLCPPALHQYPTWDLPKVLNTLTRGPFEPLWEVNLHFLSYKVAFLVAITFGPPGLRVNCSLHATRPLYFS